MFVVLMFNFNGPLQGFEQKGSPTKQGRGLQPTYGPGERRASYVNMKSLAKGRMRMVRKGAEKTYNVTSLAKGRLQKVHKDARQKGSARCAEPCTRDENFAPLQTQNFQILQYFAEIESIFRIKIIRLNSTKFNHFSSKCS